MPSSRQFNFFGTSESGVPGSGIISAYFGYFSGYQFPNGAFSGVFTPSGMIATPKGYIFGIEDNVFTPTSFSVFESGDVSSTNPNTSTFTLSPSGQFFPLISESGSIFSSFTGSVNPDNVDKQNLNLQITGEISNFGIDINNYILKITGEFPKPSLDLQTIKNIISGELTPQFFDTNTFSLLMSGNINRYERDKSNILFSFDSINWSRGSIMVEESGNDTSSFQFGIFYIGWSQLN